MRTKELEVQYHMARFEREKKSADVDAARIRDLSAQVQKCSKTETELRNQLRVYVDKFKQVCRSCYSALRELCAKASNRSRTRLIIATNFS